MLWLSADWVIQYPAGSGQGALLLDLLDDAQVDTLKHMDE